MTAQILDGKATAATIKAELTQRVRALLARGVTPGLGTILVGDDPSSAVYVAGKHRDCAELGITSFERRLPATATQADVEAVVREFNADPACTGYIIQLPLPKSLDEQAVLELMDPAKDADGLHPVNLGRLVLQKDGVLPCTPRACVEILHRYGIPTAGAHVVVIGRGVTAGRPMGLLFSRRSENATVTGCHTGTKDLADDIRRGDIVIAAAGVPGLVTANMIKPGAVVLDVASTRVVEDDGKARYVGDVAPEVREVAGWLAPMPGGIGPMTRAMLLTNVVEAAASALSR